MNPVLLGNILAFAGCTLMVAIGLLKKKNHIIIAQCFQFGIQGIANIVLGAFTGSISCFVSVLRNLVFARWKSTVTLKILFSLVIIGLSLSGLGNSPVEWIPLLGSLLLTWLLDIGKAVTLKTTIILVQSLWIGYDLYYCNYVGVAFNIFTVLANLIGIAMIYRQNHQK